MKDYAYRKVGIFIIICNLFSFCIFFSILSKDVDAVNSMVFAITIASTAFSVSDLFFTKIKIDKKELKAINKLHNFIKKAINICNNDLEAKYGKKQRK